MVHKLKQRAVPLPTDKERLEQSLAALAVYRRDVILKALAESARDLLHATDLAVAFHKVLECIGRTTGVDRVHLLTIDPADPSDDGHIIAHQLWAAPDVPTPEAFKNGTGRSLASAGLKSWATRLRRGETIAGHTADFEAPVRRFFELGGVKSAVAVPVCVDTRWWGFIGFDSCQERREWLSTEIDTLNILAEMIGATVARAHGRQDLIDANVLLTTTIECSPDAILVVDQNQHILTFNQRFVDLWRVPKELVDARDDDPVLDFVASRIRNKREFLARVRFLNAHPEIESHEEIETRDGRIIDRNSVSLYNPQEQHLGRIWFFRDISERKSAEQKMVELARTDSLTGLPNRIAFLERLQLAFARTKRGHGPFAVLYLDLDHFKDVNDTLGHPAGDELLKAVADRLRGCVRETDMVARFGGDEFAVLQDEVTDVGSAEMLAAKICQAIAIPLSIDGNLLHTTVSIGVVPCREDIDSPDAMLMKADLALYQAKDRGRDQFRIHVEELDQEARERVALGEDLRMAIARDELELHYQPQVELTTGRIIGVEALVRWNHPTRGFLLPDTFIPIAESSGNILQIGQWVIGQTCRQIRVWQDEGIMPQVVAANVSAGQFKLAADLDRIVAECLGKYDIAPDRLELELTESVLMETTQRYNEAFERLRGLGVRIAIDDFGTGYSSLDYLRSFRVSRLKIDRRFVSGSTINPDDAIIIRAVIGLAHELSVEVVAEGVETAEQRAFLISAGCQVAQGFYFGKPVSAAMTTSLLQQNLRSK